MTKKKRNVWVRFSLSNFDRLKKKKHSLDQRASQGKIYLLIIILGFETQTDHDVRQ